MAVMSSIGRGRNVRVMPFASKYAPVVETILRALRDDSSGGAPTSVVMEAPSEAGSCCRRRSKRRSASQGGIRERDVGCDGLRQPAQIFAAWDVDHAEPA